MKLFAIFAVLLLTASATSLQDKFPINFTQKRSIMTLLTQVEAQLKTKGPLDAITKQLTNFRTEINEEQASHDQLWAQQQAECASEFEFREQEVKAAEAALKEATETLDGCKAQKVRADGDLEITKRQLIEARGLLAVTVDARRREAYQFETDSTTFQLINRGIEEALEILEELWSGDASFVQLNGHVTGMLKNAVKIRKAHQLGGIMTALAQLSNKEVIADEALFNRIRNLLTNYQEKVTAEFNAAAAAEQAAIEIFEQERTRLENMIEQLTNQQQGLEAEISALKKCIATQQSIVTSATLKRDRNARIWEDAIQLCEAVEDEYHTSTDARKEELELLSAIEERVEARFAELSAGVVKRGKQDEFGYENQTVYDDSGFQPSQKE